MERKFGIELECLRYKNLDDAEVLKKVKAAGFDAVFSNKFDIKEIEYISNEAAKLGLYVEFLHAPFRGINDFWCPGLDHLPLKKNIYQSIDSAAAFDIPIIIMHVDSGWNPPKMCDVGLERFDALVEYAEKKGVKIAFENIRNFGTLSALMQRYRSLETVGYCYDCGHEHCYTETVHFTELFGPKLLCTHIHDNVGKDGRNDPDDHLMMFDGNIDYADMMKRLNGIGYDGNLTVELEKDKRYDHMTDDEYINTAYERIVKISKL
ncbi:MAG: sugar phosphate isomerase/epimerase [Clostridia bacterium]|nr:sugar phosphate isomerase/epimerase [Clostridia bacterium]